MIITSQMEARPSIGLRSVTRRLSTTTVSYGHKGLCPTSGNSSAEQALRVRSPEAPLGGSKSRDSALVGPRVVAPLSQIEGRARDVAFRHGAKDIDE
jgi:hypothetical protein